MKRIHILIFSLFIGLQACGGAGAEKSADGHGAGEADAHGHDHGAGGEDGHGHDHEDVAISHTIWQDKTELFVEFPPLVVGQEASFAAHFSDMRSFQPVTQGQVTVSLVGSERISSEPTGISRPGIFQPRLSPQNAGTYTLVFDLASPGLVDRVEIPGITVYPNAEAAHYHPPAAHPDAITLLKEQAWNMDFATEVVRWDTIREVIHAGGQVMAAQGDEQTIAATSSGMLMVAREGLTIGSQVVSGELLFRLASDNLAEHNLAGEISKARSRMETARSVYERKKELFELRAISKADYEAAELAFRLAETDFRNLSRNFGGGSQALRSPAKGFVKQLLARPGDYVEVGSPIAVISQNQDLQVRVDVPQESFGQLPFIVGADFGLGDQMRSVRIGKGASVAYGRSVSAESPLVPVYFTVQNDGSWLPGAYVEAFVHTVPRGEGLLVPASALLEAYGKYSVIVQTAGETFLEREVVLGARAGAWVEVLRGVHAGERVVTSGAFQVRMAGMASELPEHHHH